MNVRRKIRNLHYKLYPSVVYSAQSLYSKLLCLAYFYITPNFKRFKILLELTLRNHFNVFNVSNFFRLINQIEMFEIKLNLFDDATFTHSENSSVKIEART